MPQRSTHPKTTWPENKEAASRVTQLLKDSGALLERQVSKLCQDFADARHKKQGVHVSTDSITYGRDTEESPLRQIDQSVSLFKEFILDECTGVQLHIQLPIEAKYRKDIEGFGIEYPPKSYRPRFPIVGFLRGSQLVAQVKGVMPFSKLVLAHMVFLEIRAGATPQKIHNESLSYNAASALYDFVRFDLKNDEEQENLYEGKIIRHMRLVESFDQYVAEKHYPWWTVIQDWMKKNLTGRLVDEFNRRVGKGRVYYEMSAHIPIVCLNGELWSLQAGKFQTQNALLTRVRVPNWPGGLRRELIRYTPEAPLVVTNTKGLKRVLEEGLQWFLGLELCLKSADRQLKRRWHLESAFFREALNEGFSRYPENRLRSDLDVFDWL